MARLCCYTHRSNKRTKKYLNGENMNTCLVKNDETKNSPDENEKFTNRKQTQQSKIYLKRENTYMSCTK